MKNILVIGGILVVAVLAYMFFMNQPSSDTLMETYPAGSPESQNAGPDDAMMEESTVVLSEQNDSQESGIATITEENGQITVSLTMTGAPETAQPAHIHTGSCPTPGAVVYPLSNVVDGMSETTIDITLAELKGQMPLAINVHKSAAESQVYVACGDIL